MRCTSAAVAPRCPGAAAASATVPAPPRTPATTMRTRVAAAAVDAAKAAAAATGPMAVRRGMGRRQSSSFLLSCAADPSWRCRSSNSGGGSGSPGDRGPANDAPTAPARAVYQGAYGTFSIGPEDEQEVLLYRLGINTAAACEWV
eukprot:350709-Chlamydomonas_euryale.AAC.3